MQKKGYGGHSGLGPNKGIIELVYSKEKHHTRGLGFNSLR